MFLVVLLLLLLLLIEADQPLTCFDPMGDGRISDASSDPPARGGLALTTDRLLERHSSSNL